MISYLKLPRRITESELIYRSNCGQFVKLMMHSSVTVVPTNTQTVLLCVAKIEVTRVVPLTVDTHRMLRASKQVASLAFINI